MTRIIVAALAAVLLTCAPAAAQLDTRTIPQAQPLTGTERMPAVQGAGCTAKTTPCASVAITPSLISTFLAPVFQPLDTDLTAIAALATADFGRQLLTRTDAASTRTALGLGSIATQAANGVAITGGSISSLNAAYNESSTTPGFYAGLTGTPRVMFVDGSGPAWQVDNSAGTFRWFTPGTLRMSLSISGSETQLSVPGPVVAARHCYSATVCDYAGAGAPTIAAGVGSTYRRTDGGTTSTFYVKESGAGASTGWVAK